ncbi:MAG: formylglycine-generating enzyme family protein, partial [Planctomycetaceae bacterium]
LREFTADEWLENHAPNAVPAAGGPRRRTLRGGSWKDRYECLRSAYREPILEQVGDDAVGLRCVRAKVRPPAAK